MLKWGEWEKSESLSAPSSATDRMARKTSDHCARVHHVEACCVGQHAASCLQAQSLQFEILKTGPRAESMSRMEASASFVGVDSIHWDEPIGRPGPRAARLRGAEAGCRLRGRDGRVDADVSCVADSRGAWQC